MDSLSLREITDARIVVQSMLIIVLLSCQVLTSHQSLHDDNVCGVGEQEEMDEVKLILTAASFVPSLISKCCKIDSPFEWS